MPYITEMTSAQIGGPDDYSAVERRDDVLVYTTPPLEEDLEVTGPVRMELFASTSARDTDFMAKLLDVWPNGFAQRLTDGMVRGRFRKGMASGCSSRGVPVEIDFGILPTCSKRGTASAWRSPPAPFPSMTTTQHRPLGGAPT